ncbi:cyclophilin-like fold protein [Candidatus Bathyarchaeota archaeon]|nr:cyclophilin-like fold protein [Candidatus Bathyarchaeota archaeon]
MKIKITTSSTGPVDAVLSEENPRTAKAIYEALPIKGNANLWGDEIYFSIPVEANPENGKSIVKLGDLAYWPPGNAFCIFFGPTPMSHGDEIRPASAVNVFGRITGDPKVFKKVRNGEQVTIERA